MYQMTKILMNYNGNNKEVLTMQEKIHMAEESYSKFEKPKDMKMYSVYLD